MMAEKSEICFHIKCKKNVSFVVVVFWNVKNSFLCSHKSKPFIPKQSGKTLKNLSKESHV